MTSQRLNYDIDLFSIFPSSPIQKKENATVVAKVSVIFQIKSKAESELLKFGPFIELVLL